MVDSIRVYGKEDCTYCYRAKQLLDYEKVPYTYYDIEVMDQHDLRNMLMSLPRLKEGEKRTVPIIFINDQFIGGYNQLWNFFLDNKGGK